MILPCELVELKGNKETKGSNIKREKSCLKRLILCPEMPKHSKNSIGLWTEFTQFLKEQEITITCDFQELCKSKFQMPVDKEYLREVSRDRVKHYRKDNERYNYERYLESEGYNVN